MRILRTILVMFVQGIDKIVVDLDAAHRLRRWRLHEAGLLADKAAWWARRAEELDSETSAFNEACIMADTYAAASRAIREAA